MPDEKSTGEGQTSKQGIPHRGMAVLVTLPGIGLEVTDSKGPDPGSQAHNQEQGGQRGEKHQTNAQWPIHPRKSLYGLEEDIQQSSCVEHKQECLQPVEAELLPQDLTASLSLTGSEQPSGQHRDL